MIDKVKIEKRVREIIAENLSLYPQKISLDKTFEDYEADCIEVIDISMYVEDEFNIIIDERNEFPDVYEEMTIREFLDIVYNRCREREELING